MRKRLWDLAKSRIEIATILPGHRHKVEEREEHIEWLRCEEALRWVEGGPPGLEGVAEEER